MSVIYNFVYTSWHGQIDPGTPFVPHPIDLIVSDAVYAHGSYTAANSNGLPGDISITMHPFSVSTGGNTFTKDISLVFTNTITDGIIQIFNTSPPDFGFQWNKLASGDTSFMTDLSSCGVISACAFTGYWRLDPPVAAVVEPTTLSLLAVALFLLGILKWRKV